MSPRDRALYMRFQRKAATLSPDLRRELLDAYRVIRESLSDAETARLIASGQLDHLIDDAVLHRASIPVREALRESVEKGFKSTTQDLPKQGTVAGTPAVAFDTLDPTVISAVRQLESNVLASLADDVKETVRAYVENGLRDGKSAQSIARELRPILGMSPTQAENLLKYEAKLRGMKTPPTEATIQRKLAAYQKRAIALTAETNARTAPLDSLKLGQKLAWQDAIAQGIVQPGQLWKRWVTVGDSRVRDEHVAMNGEEVPFDALYSNGEDVPGESTYNCRCVSRIIVKPIAA